MTAQNQALATREQTNIDRRTDRAAFEPGNFEELRVLSIALVKSGLMPRGLDSPEKVQVAVMMGRDLGLSASQSTRTINVIDGKATLAADLIIALCKMEDAKCVYFRLVESTNTVARYETLRRGDPEPTPLSYTLEQAKTARLTGKDNWLKHPDAMLRARCGAALARIVYPDVVMGLYDPDEIEPAPRAERDVTPTPSRPTIMTQAAVVVMDAAAVVDTGPDAHGEGYAVRGARDAISKSTTREELSKAGALIRDSYKAKEITDAERIGLIADYQARNREIEAATPPVEVES